jgi:redox-sensitive bicupin YhaK (pirin superfamily)
MKSIYTIKNEAIEVAIDDFKDLPIDMKQYDIVYVGKHKAITPVNQSDKPTKADLAIELLIECRFFTETEEIYIYPVDGEIKQRTIRKGETNVTYIDKEVQLRSNSDNEARKILLLRHYIEDNGYNIQRYIKIEKQ